jgi:Amt family ammonium transporter
MVNGADTTWLLVSTALVMLMTPGLAFFYGGMVRSRNVLNALMMSMVALGVITLQWVIIGYSLSFGTDIHHVIGGLNHLFLRGVGMEPSSTYATTVPQLAFMAFQMMFAIITPALISGAVVERMKFSTYVVFILLWATLVYDPICHWVWGNGGWLANLGALDFAGGTVVHINAGISALAAALV